MRYIKKKEKRKMCRYYFDMRNWPKYNEQLVKRGEFFLDLEWVKYWDKELALMNQNKRGRPYKFPDSLIRFQAALHAKKIAFRMIEGITRQLCKIADLPEYNDYTTINRRINKLDFVMDVPTGDEIALFCDGSGFQAIHGGEYLREKYGKKHRQWVQVIILGDSRTMEPVSFEVNLVPSSESVSGKRQLKHIVDQGVNVERFGGDGAFDDLRLWQYLEDNDIQSVIKPHMDANINGPCPSRNQSAIIRQERGHKQWASCYRYGKRWPATEGIFSAIKRVFDESLAAKSEYGLVQEAKCVVWTYQQMKRYGEA